MGRHRQVDRIGDHSVKFNNEALDLWIEIVRKTGKDRIQISDDMVSGLRAQVYNTGLVSFHVSYNVGDKRPFINIGSYNKDEPDHLTIEEARHLARVIKSLGDRGVDVQDGLHKRLIFELQRDGLDWKLPKFPETTNLRSPRPIKHKPTRLK